MSQAKIILDTLVYSDTVASNDPQQKEFDWRQQWDVAAMSYPTVQTKVLTAGAFTEIILPAGSTRMTWLILLTDQDVDVLATTKTTTPTPTPPGTWNEANAVGMYVKPSAALVKDGVYFIRGAVGKLYVGVPGAVNANVTVFLGA